MWVLDPASSRDLIGRLAPHARRYEFEVAWVGEGWRGLVEQCHEQLIVDFPDYELLAIKQKCGVLAYQVFPRPWTPGGVHWSPEEHAAADQITEEFCRLSGLVCEWCGAPGSLRDSRAYLVTLCDPCDVYFPDPPHVLGGTPLS